MAANETTRATELADFLRSHRTRYTDERAAAEGETPPRRDPSPDDAESESARRPDAGKEQMWQGPGLRPDEVARLAGISEGYYTRLEQGQSVNASFPVIDALAGALHLDAGEHTHLAALAQPARGTVPGRPRRPERPRPTLVRLLRALTGIPAVLLDRRGGVLGWNRLGHALLAGHYDYRNTSRLNLTRLFFLDPHTRELYRDWHGEACRAVASLRRLAARPGDDPLLTALVGDLTVRSPEFARIWTSRPVRAPASGIRRFHHPLVGDLDLGYEVLHAGDDTGQHLLTYSAAPGGRAETTLHLLVTTLPPDHSSSARSAA